ncbi:MAG: hypothetical protein D6759_11320, partial [Chloroflexi bacterium]
MWVAAIALGALVLLISSLRWSAVKASVATESATTVYLSESFTTWPPSGWTLWQEFGTNWSQSTGVYNSAPAAAQLAATAATGDASAWLITPKINVPVGGLARITYTRRFNHFADVLLFATRVSTDYTGSGDPYNATWTPLEEINVSASTSWITVSFLITAGQPFYVAFYGQVTVGNTWYVDDVVITQEPQASVGDFVWHDLDGDGIQDAGEPGLAGVTVTLRNGATNQMISQTVTLSNGQYLFSNLTRSSSVTYLLEFQPPATYYPTRFQAGSDRTKDSDAGGKSVANPSLPIRIAPFTVTQSTDDLDVGLVIPPTIAGRVWEDADFDGLRESGEGGTSQITVSLMLTPTTLITETVPDAQGLFTFTISNDAVGESYYLQFTPWDAFSTFSPPNQGNDEARDSDVTSTTGTTAGTTEIVRPLSGQQLTLDAGLFRSPRMTISSTQGGTLATALGVTVTFAAQSVTTTTMVVYTPLFTPSVANGNLRFANRAFSLQALSAPGNQPITRLQKPYTITLEYADADWQDSRILPESSLNLYLWDGSRWQGLLPCQGCTFDPQKNRLVVVLDKVPKSNEFALMGEPAPELWIHDATVAEGNQGSTEARFTVRLQPTATQTVTVAYSTQDHTAQAGSDYQARSGSLTFAPGESQKVLTVTVLGDTTYEGDETFTVALSSPVNALIGDGEGVGTIRDDDSAAGSVTPGGGGAITTTHEVTITFPPGSVTSTVTVSYTAQITPGHSTGSFRFAGKSFRIEAVDAGGNPVTRFQKPFTITIHYRDANWRQAGIAPESSLNLAFWDGSKWVNLLPCQGCSLDTQKNILTVVLDHLTPFALLGELPSLTLADATVGEGDAGTTTAAFTVTLSSASSLTVTVDYATADGTATAGSDYTATGGTLTFNPGETQKTITVQVLGDTNAEGNETFTV